MKAHSNKRRGYRFLNEKTISIITIGAYDVINITLKA